MDKNNNVRGQAAKRLYCISDCHLGDGSKREDFIRDGYLIRLINEVNDHTDAMLIINGDFFEGWQCSFCDIIAAHCGVVNALKELNKKGRVIMVKGNHDEDEVVIFGLLTGIPVFSEYVTRGILFMHGHQFDENNSKNKWIGRTVAWIGGILELVINRDVDVWFEKVRAWMCGTGRYQSDEMDFYKTSAREYIKKRLDVHDIVLGHTHEYCSGVRLSVADGYYNTGTWTGDKMDVLIFEKN